MSLGGVIVSRPAFFNLTLVCVLSIAATGFGSNLDDRLNQKLKGGWAILEVEVYSACAGTYSDNQIGDGGVAGQELIFNILLAERLQACRVPVPTVP